jgi:hypothetical protein
MPFALGCSVRHTTPANECSSSQGREPMFPLEIGYSIDNASCFASRFLLPRENLGFTEHFRTRDFSRTPGRDPMQSAAGYANCDFRWWFEIEARFNV